MKEISADAVALLRKMVEVPSLSFEEEAVCKLISEELTKWGLEHKVLGRNIVARNAHYDAAKPTLVLDAHIDTVPAAPDYSVDPFDCGSDPEIVRGLGSNDDGASVVAMAAAFRHFYNEDMPVNIVLALSCEEEKSGPDGASMLYSEDGPEETRDAKWVIVGEPTGMRAATSERGLLVLDGLAKGVSGHAARGEGVNALYIALEDIAALRAHKFTKISPMMGEVRLNVTQIQAGHAHNVIPDSCSFVVDIRPTEQYTNNEIVEELQALCRSTLTPRNLRNCSSATFADSPLRRTAEALGIETFSSPTTSNWMRTHRDAIKMGPGDSSRSHHADEFVKKIEVENAIDDYICFINKFYGDTLE